MVVTDQPREQPMPSTPSKKPSTKLFVTVMAVVAVTILAVAAVVFMGTGEMNKDHVLRAGDFVRYQVTRSNPEIVGNVTLEILGINATHIYQKETKRMDSQTPSVVTYGNLTRNQTMFALDVNHRPPSETWHFVRTDTLQLKWGARSADHYNFTGVNLLNDVWLTHGVVAKLIILEQYLHHSVSITCG